MGLPAFGWGLIERSITDPGLDGGMLELDEPCGVGEVGGDLASP